MDTSRVDGVKAPQYRGTPRFAAWCATTNSNSHLSAKPCKESTTALRYWFHQRLWQGLVPVGGPFSCIGTSLRIARSTSAKVVSRGSSSTIAYCSTRTMTEWGMAFLRHRSVAEASCLSCHGNRWPHDSIEPGCRVNKRAGVGAGGLSPSSSFAGSFIFIGSRRLACSAAPRRRGCVGFSSVARPLSRGAG